MVFVKICLSRLEYFKVYKVIEQFDVIIGREVLKEDGISLKQK